MLLLFHDLRILEQESKTKNYEQERKPFELKLRKETKKKLQKIVIKLKLKKLNRKYLQIKQIKKEKEMKCKKF